MHMYYVYIIYIYWYEFISIHIPILQTQAVLVLRLAFGEFCEALRRWIPGVHQGEPEYHGKIGPLNRFQVPWWCRGFLQSFLRVVFRWFWQTLVLDSPYTNPSFFFGDWRSWICWRFQISLQGLWQATERYPSLGGITGFTQQSTDSTTRECSKSVFVAILTQVLFVSCSLCWLT